MFNLISKINTILLPLFVTLFSMFSFATPAFANSWGSDDTKPDYKCGEEDVYEAGSITNEEAAAQDARNWAACNAMWAIPENPEAISCFSSIKATTVRVPCDYSEHVTTQNATLQHRRASARQAAFLDVAVPDATNDTSIIDDPRLIAAQKKTSWNIIRPKVGAVLRSELRPTLSDDPDVRWGFATADIWKHYNDPRPVVLMLDPYTRGVSDMTPTSWDVCLNFDASAKVPGQQNFSEAAGVKMFTISAPFNDTLATLSWSQSRTFLANPPMGLNEVDETGTLISASTPDAGGLALRFVENGDKMWVYWPDRCTVIMEEQAQAAADAQADAQAEAQAQAEADELARQKLFNSDFFVGGNFNFAPVHIPSDSPFNVGTGWDASSHIEAGGVLGNGNISWVIGGETGVAWDTSCLQPAGLDLGAFTGPWINRSGRVGFTALANGSWMSAPYNGTWLTTRVRVGVDLGLPIQLGPRPLDSKTYLIPFIGMGADFVYGESSPYTYVLTTRRVGVGGGLKIVRTF